MKYSHFLCTLERANQEKLKLAIMQLKCVPCLNKFTTNFNLINSNSNGLNSNNNCINANSSNSNSLNSKNMVSHANMSRLLKQMSLIVSTELQQIAIDLIERMDEDKPVKYIKLKDEFKLYQHQQSSVSAASYHHHSQASNSSSSSNESNKSAGNQSGFASLLMKQHQQINGVMKNLTNSFAKKLEISSSSSSITSIGSTQSGTNTNSTANTNTTTTTTTATSNNNNTNLNASVISSSQSPSPVCFTALSNSQSINNGNQTQGQSNKIFNPHSNLQQFITEQKAQDLSPFSSFSIDRNTSVVTNSFNYDRI